MRRSFGPIASIPVNSRPSSQLKTILLVDTSDQSRIAGKWFLGNFGYVVDSVCSAEEALIVFNATIHDAVVTDFSMSGMNGCEMAHIIKLRSPRTPVVLYSRVEPADRRCIDAVVRKSEHLLLQDQLLVMKEMLDHLLMTPVDMHASENFGIGMNPR